MEFRRVLFRSTLVALRQVDESLRQAVLDEWAARCNNQVVRNPAGYLIGIIQRAISGDFKPWAGKSKGPAPTKAPISESPPREVVPHEVALEHLNRLRELVVKDEVRPVGRGRTHGMRHLKKTNPCAGSHSHKTICNFL